MRYNVGCAEGISVGYAMTGMGMVTSEGERLARGDWMTLIAASAR